MSTRRSSVAFASETVFANTDPATGLPVIPHGGGLDFKIAGGVAYTDVSTVGEVQMNSRDTQVRDRAEALPDEPVSMLDASGDRVDLSTGQFTITFEEVTPIGAPAPADPVQTYADLPIALALDSALFVEPSAIPADVVAAGIDANSFTSTVLLGAYNAGVLLSMVINGRAEYTAITRTDPNLLAAGRVDYSPEVSRTLANPDDVRQMRTYGPAQSLAAGKTVAIRFDGVGWRTYCYGCILTGISATVNNHRLQFALTFQAALVMDDHANSDVADPIYPSGSPAHLLGCYVEISDDAVPSDGSSTPYAQGRETLDVDEAGFDITMDVTRRGQTQTLAGAGWEITNVQCTASITLSEPTPTVEFDYRDEVRRSVLIGFGPGGTEGEGIALYIPAGVLTADPNLRETGGERVRQQLQYNAGRWRGDDSPANSLLNSSFRLGMGM